MDFKKGKMPYPYVKGTINFLISFQLFLEIFVVLNVNKNIRRKKLFLEEYYHGLFTNLIKKFDKLNKDILTVLSCSLENSNHRSDFEMLEFYFLYLIDDSGDLPILSPPEFLIDRGKTD